MASPQCCSTSTSRADRSEWLQVDQIVQGSQYSGVSGVSGIATLPDAANIKVTLARLVYTQDGAWAARIETGSWALSAGVLQSGSVSSPTVFLNTTVWCGETWEASLELVAALDNGEGAGGISVVKQGTSKDSSVLSQVGKQCKVRLSVSAVDMTCCASNVTESMWFKAASARAL